jgi:hypothetical protein
MRPVLWLSAAFAAAFWVHTASAADVKAVLDACDNTSNCGYTINGSGDISGCSGETCFYCPNDGKRECFGVGAARVQPGSKPKHMPGPDNLLTDMKASPKPVKPKLETGVMAPAAPAVSD